MRTVEELLVERDVKFPRSTSVYAGTQRTDMTWVRGLLAWRDSLTIEENDILTEHDEALMAALNTASWQNEEEVA